MTNEKIYRRAVKRINQTVKGLGKWDILDGNIVCIVNKNNKYKFKQTNFYHIYLSGLYDNILSDYSLSDLNLQDKKIVYHISNFVFDEFVEIEAYNNADIIFNNCTFNDDIGIIKGDNVSFVKCKFKNDSDEIVFATSDNKRYINKIHLSGCDIDQNISMFLSAGRVDIINSKIDNIRTLVIDSFEAVIGASKLNIKESEFNCDKIIFKDSSIKCDVMAIDSSDFRSVGFQYFNVNDLFYNDVEFGRSLHTNGVVTKGNPFNPTESDVLLQNNRLLLLEVLKETLNKCDNIIDKDIEKIRKEERDNSVIRVLKK